jgi:DNA-binding NtrC family response regulator
MSRQPLRIVAVSDDALRSKLLDALLDDASIHDVVFVEPLASAYKRIRQLAPGLIIVLMRIDDEAACQLLTMLELDRELLGIPVVTWAAGEHEGQIDYIVDSLASTGYNEMAYA